MIMALIDNGSHPIPLETTIVFVIIPPILILIYLAIKLGLMRFNHD